MVVALRVESTLPKAAEKVAAMAGRLEAAIPLGLAIGAEQIESVIVPAVKDRTPVAPGPRAKVKRSTPDSGYLRASTDSRLETEGAHSTRVTVFQPAETPKGQYYAGWVDFGHMVMGGPGHRVPLYWWTGYEYGLEALDAVEPNIAAISAATGLQIASRAVRG